jgi:hypothetical protein
MKIALIGNMNNNHFAMMRYFHDLGVEAHLFKFANEFEHFQPECDTYTIEKWKPFIHQTSIVNGDFKQYLSLSSNDLFKIFNGYDYYIGNGMSPAYLSKAGITLNLFVPYGVGIEYTYRTYKNGIWDSIKEKIVKYIQEKAIKKNVSIVCTSEENTIKKSLSLGKETKKLSIPMVYPEDKSLNSIDLPIPIESFRTIDSFDFKVFSHVSHVQHDSLIYQMKRNDILIESFALYIKNNPTHKSVLVLLSYGDDIENSKRLIKEFNIEKNVVWLPLMNRKDLIVLIGKMDIGASEFGGYTWGGTGWEFLCSGKLFFHYINLTDSEIEQTLGMPLPPFVNSNSPTVIAEKMGYYYNHRDELKTEGELIRNWFESNAGIDLAAKYIALLK